MVNGKLTVDTRWIVLLISTVAKNLQLVWQHGLNYLFYYYWIMCADKENDKTDAVRHTYFM